jgi:hypothetical protein
MYRTFRNVYDEKSAFGVAQPYASWALELLAPHKLREGTYG